MLCAWCFGGEFDKNDVYVNGVLTHWNCWISMKEANISEFENVDGGYEDMSKDT